MMYLMLQRVFLRVRVLLHVPVLALRLLMMLRVLRVLVRIESIWQVSALVYLLYKTTKESTLQNLCLELLMGLVLLRLLTMLLCGQRGALHSLVQGLQRHLAVRAQWAARGSKVSAQGDLFGRGTVKSTVESTFQNVCLVQPGRLACLRDESWCWP